MMQENDFHRAADDWLTTAADVLEEVDTALDVECHDGILTVALPSGQTLLVNKHAPSRQLWLSSPLSGGLHFSYDATVKRWVLADGRELGQVLSQDLQSLTKITVSL